MRNALAGVERALFLTLVFAAFAATLAALGARAVDRIAVAYEIQRDSYAIVRVLAPEGPAAMFAAESALSRSPHVARAAPMSAERAAALLGDVDPATLPELRLIEIDLVPGTAAADIEASLTATLAQSGVSAEVVRAPAAGGASGWVRTAAMWGAAAFALVMAAIISLASRSFAARRRELVTVMADCGATRAQTAGRIADEAAVLGLYAGAIGGGLAGLIALVLLLALIPGAGFDTLARVILPIDIAPIVAAPLLAAVAAGAGARAAASFFHAQAARLG